MVEGPLRWAREQENGVWSTTGMGAFFSQSFEARYLFLVVDACSRLVLARSGSDAFFNKRASARKWRKKKKKPGGKMVGHVGGA